MHASPLQSPDSWMHVGAGMATAFVSPWLSVPYGAYLVSKSSSQAATPGCPNYIVQGVEYGLGYFGALLAYQTFTNLNY